MSIDEKLDLLLKEITSLKNELALFKPDLTIEKTVIAFLEKDKRTFRNYIEKNVLREGIHYYNNGDRRIYIPDKIVEFKRYGCKNPDGISFEMQKTLKSFGL